MSERCYGCGQFKPIVLTLRSEEEDRPLCKTCATRWLLSEEEWPPAKTSKSKAKTSTLTSSEIPT